jgi:hypothetical protein
VLFICKCCASYVNAIKRVSVIARARAHSRKGERQADRSHPIQSSNVRSYKISLAGRGWTILPREDTLYRPDRGHRIRAIQSGPPRPAAPLLARVQGITNGEGLAATGIKLALRDNARNNEPLGLTAWTLYLLTSCVSADALKLGLR